MHTHKVPRHACPTCGIGNDRATELPGVNDGDKPKVGDHLICFNCGQLCRLGVGFVLEPADIPASASKKERAQVKKAQALIRARGLIRPPIIHSKWGRK